MKFNVKVIVKNAEPITLRVSRIYQTSTKGETQRFAIYQVLKYLNTKFFLTWVHVGEGKKLAIIVHKYNNKIEEIEKGQESNDEEVQVVSDDVHKEIGEHMYAFLSKTNKPLAEKYQGKKVGKKRKREGDKKESSSNQNNINPPPIKRVRFCVDEFLPHDEKNQLGLLGKKMKEFKTKEEANLFFQEVEESEEELRKSFIVAEKRHSIGKRIRDLLTPAVRENRLKEFDVQKELEAQKELNEGLLYFNNLK